jgi:hypothetical protein
MPTSVRVAVPQHGNARAAQIDKGKVYVKSRVSRSFGPERIAKELDRVFGNLSRENHL